jgi:flagellar FliL protein
MNGLAGSGTVIAQQMANLQGAKMSQEPEPAVPPAPKQGRLKKILILTLLTVFLGVGGGLAYLLLSDDPAPMGTASQAAPAPSSQKAIMSLDPFLVNLADRENRRYLKLKMDLEVTQEKSIKELEKSLPPIRDAMISLLSSKGYAEICTVEGKRQLKQEILQKMAAIPGGQQVTNIYFTEFVAQ